MSNRPLRRLPSAGGHGPIKSLEMQEFGRKLHELRTVKGLSQSDVARGIWGEQTDANGRKSAKNRDRISQYEKGLSFPEPQNLARLAELLGVDPDTLAPEVVAATVDHENPAVQMTMVAGHYDKVHLRVNLLVPLKLAAQVVGLLSALEA